MNGRTLLIAAGAALVGLIAGFLIANSINRSELSALRAEADRARSAPGNSQLATSTSSTLTDEEIEATIARADQNPKDFDVQRNIGGAIYRYGAMKQDEKLIKRAIGILDRAQSLRPDDFDVILALGNAHFDIGYFNKENESLLKAREFYTKALSAKPENVDIQTDLALTYFLQTPPDYDNAVAEFRRALDRNPKHEKALQWLVQALIKQNKSDQASQYLERLRAVNPNNESIGELTSMLAASQPAG